MTRVVFLLSAAIALRVAVLPVRAQAPANPAISYEAAIREMPELTRQGLDILKQWKTAPFDPATRQLVEAHEKSLDQMYRAMRATEACDWGLDLSTGGLAMDIPHARPSTLLAKAALLRARQRLLQGKVREAAGDVLAVRRLARDVSRTECVLTSVTSYGIESMALDFCEEFGGELTRVYRSKLLDSFLHLDPLLSPALAVDAERVYYRWLAARLEKAELEGRLVIEAKDLFENLGIPQGFRELEAFAASWKTDLRTCDDLQKELVREIGAPAGRALRIATFEKRRGDWPLLAQLMVPQAGHLAAKHKSLRERSNKVNLEFQKMNPPLEHPAAWTGTQLPARADWEIPFADLDPARLQHDLEHGSGACRVRGFPLDGLDDAACRAAFLQCVSRIGTPVSQSAAGELVFGVRDAGLADDDPRARGPNTRKKLSFHADRCDVIAFLCVQPAREGGENDIVSSMALYNQVAARRPDLLEVLLVPFHYARHTVDHGNQKPWCRQPVFSFTDGHFACNLLRVLIDRAAAMPELPDLTPLQVEALDYVQSVAEESAMHHRFRLERGDLLFLNNWVTLHRRTAFTDFPEPERRRLILRAWLSMPNSRPLDPMFRDNYGAVEPGAIRGGMRPAS